MVTRTLSALEQTEAYLAQAGVPVKFIGSNTVAYWLAQGLTPERIAVEIFRVPVVKES